MEYPLNSWSPKMRKGGVARAGVLYSAVSLDHDPNSLQSKPLIGE